MRPKLYLAGPEVFLPDAVEYAATQRALCDRYGFTALHPLDNSLDLGNQDLDTAMRIYRGDVQQIRDCDIVVANCNGFRGMCMDDGTAYELGFANALGKPSYGYIAEVMSQVARTIREPIGAPHLQRKRESKVIAWSHRSYVMKHLRDPCLTRYQPMIMMHWYCLVAC